MTDRAAQVTKAHLAAGTLVIVLLKAPVDLSPETEAAVGATMAVLSFPVVWVVRLVLIEMVPSNFGPVSDLSLVFAYVVNSLGWGLFVDRTFDPLRSSQRLRWLIGGAIFFVWMAVWNILVDVH